MLLQIYDKYLNFKLFFEKTSTMGGGKLLVFNNLRFYK